MGYYSALTRNGILKPAPTWLDLDVALSGVSQTQKDRCCVCPLGWGFLWIGKLTETGSRLEVARGGGEGSTRTQSHGGQSFVLEWWYVREPDHADGFTTLWTYSRPLNCTLQKWLKWQLLSSGCFLTTMFKRTEPQENNIIDDKSNTAFLDLVLCSNHCWFLWIFLCVGLGSGAEDSGANSEGSHS